MAVEEDDHDGFRRHGSLVARKIPERSKHGTEFGLRDWPTVHLAQVWHGQPASFPTKPDTPRFSEPILIPKLRIQFADFPYPTLFYRLKALYLGDLLRMWVRNNATPPRGLLLDF